MNSILMIVIAVVILLLVFVMFSLDEREDDEDFIQEKDANDEKTDRIAEVDEKQVVNVSNAEKAKVLPIVAEQSVREEDECEEETIEIGSEVDLRFRLMLQNKLALPRDIEHKDAAVVSVQLRFSEETVASENFLQILKEAEKVFERDFSFPFSAYQSSQLNRFWIFSKDEDRDDNLFEALVVPFELVSRFKNMLAENTILRDAKAKIAIGISHGDIVRINRGMFSDPSWVGKALFMSETLAEAAGDLSIYADEAVYKASLPLFDFREWKPVKLRSPIPAVPLFELVGWNKPEEIAEFASHELASSRKAVAVAYRYLELDNNIQPLIELLSDGNAEVALEALETVKVIGNKQIFSFLKKIFLEAQDPVFKSAMIDAFASIGNSEIVPVILGSTKEKSWLVRLSAVKALYKLSGQDAIRYIDPLSSDKDVAVQACVNGILAKATGNSNYLKKVKEIINDLSVRGKKAAADELLDIDNEKALQILADCFSSQDIELQRYMLRKLSYSKCKTLYQCFLTIFKESDEASRFYITEAMRRAELVD